MTAAGYVEYTGIVIYKSVTLSLGAYAYCC